MIDKKYIELIEKEIDGTITSEEKAVLRKWMEKEPEAEKCYQEQIQVSRLLHQIPTVEPPPGLKKRIINSVSFKGDAVKIRKPAFRPSIFKKFSKYTPRLAFAFGAGLLVGIILHMVFFTDTYDMSSRDFIGTIGMHEKGRFEKLDQIHIDLPDVKGELTLNKFNNLLGFEINLHSKSEFDLFLGFNSTHIQFHGFKPYNQTKIVLENERDHIRSINSGAVRYVVFLSRESRAATQIDVKILQMGNVQYHKEMRLVITDQTK